MPCVLWVSGDFTSDQLVEKIQLQPYKKIEKGEVVSKNGEDKKYELALCGFDVSDKDFTDLKAQVPDAIDFLVANFEQLRNLHQLPQAVARLDFGYFSSFVDTKIVAQYDVLPAKLLKLAGELNIDIELSQYWHSDTAETKN